MTFLSEPPTTPEVQALYRRGAAWLAGGALER